jgi:hypothetical protein
VALMRRHFDEIIASILDPGHYAVWFVPILGARKPMRFKQTAGTMVQ